MNSGTPHAQNKSGENQTPIDDGSKPNIENPTLADFLLALLYLDQSSPIKGKIMLMKQAFILTKEVAPQQLQQVEFFPYKWGPYSNDVAEVLTQYLRKNIMALRSEGGKDVFVLTEKGMEKAREAVKKIPKNILEDITNLKRTTEEIGLKRFLEFIYSNYPLYSVGSWGEQEYC